MDQAHILYSGTVQGVGFRYNTYKFAQTLNLKGWVKNLADGRVEILTEGPKEKIEMLCQRLEDYFQGYIKDKKIEFKYSKEQFDNFTIV